MSLESSSSSGALGAGGRLDVRLHAVMLVLRARRHAGPASSEGARHVIIRLTRRMRTWRACIRSHAARARSSTCTLNMLAAAVRARARHSAAGSSRQAHREAYRLRCGSSVQERASMWSARRHAGPASSEGARHVNIRLIRGMRTWRACIRSHDARARSSMHA